jgi:hypothetical protein
MQLKFLQQFAITWKIDSEDGSRGILGKTYVDGSLIGRRACFGGDQRVNTKQYEGAEIDDTTCKPFRFAPIALTGSFGFFWLSPGVAYLMMPSR